MANSHRNGNRNGVALGAILERYTRLNAIVGVAGLFSTFATLFVYEWMTFEWLLFTDYTIQTDHMLALYLVALLVAFGASKTRNWYHYTWAERIVVIGGVAITIGQWWSTEVADVVFTNEYAQFIFGLWAILVWLVVGR